MECQPIKPPFPQTKQIDMYNDKLIITKTNKKKIQKKNSREIRAST